MTRSELATWIVRMGERFPDRVGLPFVMATPDCSDHCIAGQISHDSGTCKGQRGWIFHWPDFMAWPEDAVSLMSKAVHMNNAGARWRDIPIELGLVPGEGDPEVEAPLTYPPTPEIQLEPELIIA